ncbi:MAG: S9 family peptidase [archaeon]|nr:S9 family peptidase [archaeon]
MQRPNSKQSSQRFAASRSRISHDLKRYLNIRSVSSPKFASDGKHLIFLANMTGVPQIWMTEAEPDVLNRSMELLSVDSEERVGFVECALSKDLIVYGVDTGGNERYQINVIENKGKHFKRITNNPKVIHEFGSFSRDEHKLSYSSNFRDQTFFDVYIQDLESDTNAGELVYQSNETNVPIEWSPDQASLLFRTIYAPFNHDLFLLELSSLKARRILEHKGDAVFDYATFSKDGRFVFCISNVEREFSELVKIGVNDERLDSIHSEGASEIELLRQSPDGKLLAFAVNSGGFSKIRILKSDSAADGEPKEVKLPIDSVVLDLAWSVDSSKLTFTLTSSILNTNVWIYDIEKDLLAQITKISTSGIDESSFLPSQIWKYKSFDGLEISSFLFLPKDQRENYPLLVLLHGGPESQFRPTFNPLIQYFLHLGFAVGVPNFRGSTGYGRTFTHLDDVRNRMNTVKDVESFIVNLRGRSDLQGKIDFGKIAAWGGSYGGFMVLACLYANPDLWAAGVDIVGIANFVTFLRNTGPWRRKLRIAEYGDPDKDNEFLSSISPVTNAEKIRAPLFVIHGANDPRVPLEEAEQITSTLERLGRRVHLMKFDAEGHGLHKIKDRIEGYSQALAFLLDCLEVPAL